MGKNKRLSSALLILGLTFGAQAQEAAPQSEPLPDEALLDLLQALDQETQIATKTKMNIDFVPGMVSVLYGEELAAKGVRDAAEALALIPGVELSISGDGTTLVFVRGIGSVFASGKIKVLLNGVDFNSTLSVASTALTLPVELIDRIEVIRGPGSTLYGEFAYSGVVNVVTRQKDKNAFVRVGNLGQKTLGAQWSHEAENGWRASLGFTGTNIDGDDVESGPDVLRNTPWSRAPGPTNEIEEDRALLLRTGFKDFSFNVQWSQVYSGDHFGIANALPDPEPKLLRKVGMLSVDVEQLFALGPKLDARVTAGWLDYHLESGLHELYPPGIMGNHPVTGQPFFPDGVLGSPNYEERKYHAGAEFHFTGQVLHDWVAGLAWSYTDQGDTYAVRNYNPGPPLTPAPLATYRGSANWQEEGMTRRLLGVYMQDQYSFSEHLTLTAGVRYDSYDDVGSATSPRIAAVYQLSEKQTLKAQFARAFRPPTFLETGTKNNPVVAGNPDISPELIDNYELGYIYNDGVTTARATGYFADLHDLIVVDPATRTYVNKGEVNVLGVELEFARQFGHQFRLDTSVAFIDAEDEADETPMADVARISGNLGLLYRPRAGLTAALQCHYVGERERAAGDARDDLPGYRTVDLTLSRDHLWLGGLSARVGVHNLFDAEVVYPAPLVSFNNAVIPSYPEDYPRPGRELWVQAQYAFK
jgi:iron complex outermembrane receptor protein